MNSSLCLNPLIELSDNESVCVCVGGGGLFRVRPVGSSTDTDALDLDRMKQVRVYSCYTETQT